MRGLRIPVVGVDGSLLQGGVGMAELNQKPSLFPFRCLLSAVCRCLKYRFFVFLIDPDENQSETKTVNVKCSEWRWIGWFCKREKQGQGSADDDLEISWNGLAAARDWGRYLAAVGWGQSDWWFPSQCAFRSCIFRVKCFRLVSGRCDSVIEFCIVRWVLGWSTFI